MSAWASATGLACGSVSLVPRLGMPACERRKPLEQW